MKTTSIRDMVQLDLDDRCVWMDESRVVALFGVVTTLTVGLARSMVNTCSEDGFVEDGGNDP